MDQGLSAVVCQRRIRARVQKCADHGRSPQRGRGQGGSATPAARVGIRAPFQEPNEDLGERIRSRRPGRDHQRGAEAAEGFDVRSRVEQRVDHPRRRGSVEGGAIGIRVDVGAGFQQQGRHRGVVARQVKRGDLVVLGGVHVAACAYQDRRDGAVAVAQREVERRVVVVAPHTRIRARLQQQMNDGGVREDGGVVKDRVADLVAHAHIGAGLRASGVVVRGRDAREDGQRPVPAAARSGGLASLVEREGVGPGGEQQANRVGVDPGVEPGAVGGRVLPGGVQGRAVAVVARVHIRTCVQ